MDLSTELRGGRLTVIKKQKRFNFLKKILENGLFLHSVIKQHRIKYQELICPTEHRNCNNLL